MRPLLAAWLGAVIGAGIGLIATELALLSRREFLPMDPGYRVRSRVTPSGGETGPDAVRLAVLGDSTVAGVGSPTEGESLPVLLAQRVADATGRPVDVVGHGVSGARVASTVRDQLPLLARELDAVVVVVGANDATHATPPWRFRRDTEALLRSARGRGRASVVVLGGTPRFHRNQVIPEPLRTLLDRYSSLLRLLQVAAVESVPGARFVDIAREASPRFAGVPEATSPDGFHPSPIGYGFWADAIAPTVFHGLRRDG